MTCPGRRHDWERSERTAQYHGSRRAVGVTLLRCELEQGHDGLCRTSMGGMRLYYVSEVATR